MDDERQMLSLVEETMRETADILNGEVVIATCEGPISMSKDKVYYQLYYSLLYRDGKLTPVWFRARIDIG